MFDGRSGSQVCQHSAETRGSNSKLDYKYAVNHHILEDRTQIAGFIVFYPHEDHLHIENVAVLPKFQGNGYGTKLIEFAEHEAKNLGFSKVELYTNEKMTENIVYYPTRGYEEIGRWQEDGFNRIYFRKIL